ncbi:MAG: alpha/beta hydrolase family protein [Promethearchaeota archaeon]
MRMIRLRTAIVSLFVLLAGNLFLLLGLLVAKEFLLVATLCVVFVLSFYLIVKLGTAAFTGDFLENVDLSLVEREWVEVPREAGGVLHAVVVRDARDGRESPEPAEGGDVPAVKKPYVIVAHGAGGNARNLELLYVPLALNGFHVVAFNQSGHGDPPHVSAGNGKRYPEVMVDVHDVVNFVLEQPDLVEATPSRIGFVGHSTGGVMALSQAYLNPDIKVTVALSGVHDFSALVKQDFPAFSPQWWFKKALKLGGFELEYSEEENRLISPKYCLEKRPENEKRVFMIHSGDDPLPISEAEKNQELAGVPDGNCLFLERGGHNFRAQETIIASQVLAWFLEYL